MPMSKTIAVIGDIHGCYNTLENLFPKLKNIPEIYSVGDLVDRGLHSREVIQFCMDNLIRPVRGNHEDMLLNAIDKSDKFFGFMSKDSELYYYNGGRETQYSYIQSRLFSNFKKFRNEFRSSGHYDYLRKLPLKYDLEKVVISHAGIIEGGDDYSIIWNRSTPAVLDKLQIFGHTPVDNLIYYKNYYSNIDTGCVFKNKLTAVIVDTKLGSIIDTIQEDFHPSDME